MGRLLGVDIHIDWSLLIIFALIALNLGAAVLPMWHPEWSTLLVWTVALFAAVLFFVSVLLHELSHAVVAKRNGIPVSRITLFLFGGMAHMEREPPSAGAEFKMAIVGPITSLAIGVAATFAGTYLAGDSLRLAAAADSATALQTALSEVGPTATLLLWLGPINILLGLFNLVPGFPLDGGRVMRSVLWKVTGDLTRATRWAAMGGQLFAFALIAFGVFNVFGGALIQGMWLLLIGWFLNKAAQASYQQLLVRNALEDVPVSRIMQTHLQRLPADLSIDSFVANYLMASDQQAFPVETDGRLVGLIDMDDVRRVPKDSWRSVTVARVMTPVDELSALSPHDGAEEALARLAASEVDQIPVVADHQLLGLVRQKDLFKWLAVHGQQDGP